MNTSAPASSTASSVRTTSQAQGSSAKERSPGGHSASGGDLFAQLLLLLSAGTDATSAPLTSTADGLPGSTADTPASADDLPQPLLADTTPSQTNPLLHLLGWSAAPAPLLASPLGTGAGGDNTTAGPAVAAPGLLGAATGPASLQAGLQPLATPETLDADTLLALGLPTPAAAAAAGGAPASVTGSALARHPGDARAPLGVHVTAWRSTTTLAHVASSHGAATGLTAAERSAAPLPGHPTQNLHSSPLPPDPRSAMAPDSPTADTEAAPGLAGTAGRAITPSEPGTLFTDAGAAASGQGSEGGGQETAARDDHTPDDAPPSPYGTPSEADDAASTPWGAQHLRHASLRVGDAGEGAIDIQLSMTGQALEVAFRTDDEQARAQLAQDAGNALGELLQRSGIELGGVSVGGQGAQAGQDPAGRAPQPPQGPRAEAGASRPTAVDTASRNAATPRPRDDGSRPLDLFV